MNGCRDVSVDEPSRFAFTVCECEAREAPEQAVRLGVGARHTVVG